MANTKTRIERVEDELRAKGYRKTREIGLGNSAWLAWWSGRTTLLVQDDSEDNVEVYGPLDSTNSMSALLAAIPGK